MRPIAVIVLATLLLAGCSSWFEDTKAPIPGKRISVMAHAPGLAAEPQSQPVVLPAAQRNADWPEASGVPSHDMQHLDGGDPHGTVVWHVNAGSSASSSSPLLAPPIVAAGRVYTMDNDHKVHAFDIGSGKKLWSADLAGDTDDDDTIVGGLAYDQGRIFASTGFGDLVALDATDGKELWREAIGAPMHGPPTVDSGRVFVITLDDVLHVRSAFDGSEVWPPHRAISEPATLLGTASPAVGSGVVFAPFSSGEVTALRTDNGRPLWTLTLGSPRSSDELALLSDIRARPVFDGRAVYVISYSGDLAAIDARTGERLWDREIGGINTPWLAGRYLYLISNENQLICLNADNGSIVWLTQLPVFKNPKDFKDPIIWVGPVLSGDRLIVFGSFGDVQSFSPYDGSLKASSHLSDGVSIDPAIADGMLFVLDNDANLTAFR